jgi:hypothetical protein
MALAFTAPVARADGGAPARIRDIRVGDHDGYERLVIELDSDTDVAWENGPEPGEESFYIAAAPARPSRVIVTQLPHVGTISITEMKGGTHVAIEPRNRRVRAYLVDQPPRLVVDFAAPEPGPFAAPVGARALEPAKTIGPLVTEPEPAPPKVAPKPPTPTPQIVPKPSPEPVVKTEPASAPTPAARPKPEVMVEPAPQVPSGSAKAEAPPEATPAPPSAPVVEAPAETPAAPVPTPAPTAMPTPAAKAPKVAKPAPVAPGKSFPFGIALAALAGLAVLIAGAAVVMRRRAAREDDSFSVFPPEEADALLATGSDEISPAEILAAGDHEGMLEKRLDEEVRARLELEQRFAHANEELKVLRDRLHRLERRREGAG